MTATLSRQPAADTPPSAPGTRGDGPTASPIRRLALGALAAVAVAVAAVVLLSGGSTYTINAHFLDAGQLVTGGLVEVAGRDVGTIANGRLRRAASWSIGIVCSSLDRLPDGSVPATTRLARSRSDNSIMTSVTSPSSTASRGATLPDCVG